MKSGLALAPARALLAIGAAVLVACSTPAPPGSSAEAVTPAPIPLPPPPWRDGAPLAVTSGQAEWTDPSRDRTITALWSAPARAEALLLILPGLAQGNSAPPALIEAMAGAGFAVVTLGHPGNDATVWQGPEARRADFTQAARRMYAASEAAERGADVRHVLDHLERQTPSWLPKEALRRVGVIGIGLGAQTVQSLLGETMAHGQPPIVEPRLKAAALLGPYVGFEGPAMHRRYDAIVTPLLIAYGQVETDPYGLGMTSQQRRAMVAELRNARVIELRLPSSSLPGLLPGQGPGQPSGSASPSGGTVPMSRSEPTSRTGRPGGSAPPGGSITPRANPEMVIANASRSSAMTTAERAARVALLLSLQAFFEAQLLGSADAREWLEGPHPGPVQWAIFPAGRQASSAASIRTSP